MKDTEMRDGKCHQGPVGFLGGVRACMCGSAYVDSRRDSPRDLNFRSVGIRCDVSSDVESIDASDRNLA